MNFTITEIILIIFSQIILLFLYNLFIKKDEKKNDIFTDKLKLLDSIFEHTNHDKIIILDEIKKIELTAKTINVFSPDIYRDVKDKGQFANGIYNVGTFYNTVSKNLKRNKQYNYFMKKDANFRHSLINFFTSHENIENVDFIIIPSEKYYFYDEVYLYEFENGDIKGYEFLPSISNENEERLYYLELDEKQVRRLLDIKDNLIKKYQDNSQKDIKQIKSKIGEFVKK